jgi:hypothetical protein
MQELLLGTWGSQIVAYGQQYPWRVFAAVMVALVLLDLLFRNNRSSSDGDFGGLGFGDGDGDGGGD